MKLFSAPTISAVAFAAFLTASPASAQNAESWVSKSGADANPCTVAQPCATLQHAINQTNAGGQVNFADAGEYQAGVVSIAKDIAIVNDGAGDAIISAGTGIVVSVSGQRPARLGGARAGRLPVRVPSPPGPF